jgi:large subunit ribosomal protein L4
MPNINEIMELQVYTIDGSEAGRTVTLDESVFGIEPNDHVLWLEVRRIQANGRQGTHKTKERGEVAGSTRKLYRQKGTGNARAGSAKSPIRKTGGRTFGPRPRSYGLKLNKKTRQLARRSALTYKAQGEALRIIADSEFEQPSTRQLIGMVEKLDLAGQKVLFLTTDLNQALYRSSRNVAKLNVQQARNASAVDLLNAKVVIVQEGALDVLSETLGTAPPAEAAE